MELTQREKTWILVALVVLIPLGLIRFAFIPLRDYNRNIQTTVSRLEEKIRQIDLMGQKLKHLEMTRSGQADSLSKRIDRLLRQNQLRDRSRTIVDTGPDGRQRLVLKLDEINLTELVKIVYAIENASPVIAIKTIEIDRAFKNKNRFRVSSALSSW